MMEEGESFDSGDYDTCTEKELQNLFTTKYTETSSYAFTKEKEYLASSSLLSQNINFDLGLVTSDRRVHVIDVKSFKTKYCYLPHDDDITELTFSKKDPHLIFTSSIDGFIKLWDLRSNKCSSFFNNKVDEKSNKFTAFDVDKSDKFLVAGTELIGEEAYLLFWDLREKQLLGAYWESHADEIYRVKFRPDSSRKVATAGADNLLNIFDISKENEDDALLEIKNTDSALEHVQWTVSTSSKISSILCQTFINSVQLWDIDEAIPRANLSREDLTEKVKRNHSYECYPVILHQPYLTDNPMVMVGSGMGHLDNSCLRTLKWSEETKAFKSDSVLVGNNVKNNSIIKVAIYVPDEDKYIIVKENNRLCIYEPSKRKNNSPRKNKMANHMKNGRLKPY